MCSDQVIIPFHSRREIFVTTMGTSEPNKRDWQVYLILILTPVMGSLTWVGFRVNLLRISISHTPRVLLWVLSFFTCAAPAMDMMNMTTSVWVHLHNMFYNSSTHKLCLRSSATSVTVPVMDMMPFHTLVGMDMLWFPNWMPRYILFIPCVVL